MCQYSENRKFTDKEIIGLCIMVFPQLPSPLYFSYVIHHGFCKLGSSLISQRHFSTHDTLRPSLNFEQFRFSDTLRPSLNFGVPVSPSQLVLMQQQRGYSGEGLVNNEATSDGGHGGNERTLRRQQVNDDGDKRDCNNDDDQDEEKVDTTTTTQRARRQK